VGKRLCGRGYQAILQTGKSPDPVGRWETHPTKTFFINFFSPKKIFRDFLIEFSTVYVANRQQQ
jgi:hypothetical protein